MDTDTSIVSVSQLTRSIKSLLEGAYPFVWVRGQVTNCSRPSSGHVYFSLKDEEAGLAAVWFLGQQKRAETFDPLTGEVFEDGPRKGLAGRLENGMEVICAGRLTVYPPRGAYQLVVELAQEAGLGRLQQEFERLKAALAARGFFSQERKRPLPRHPMRVALITAPSGAAVHDFLRMAQERGCGGEIRIFPTPVQGDGAPARIAEALEAAVADGWAEVAVLIRGGGSLEDLWAFNTEVVARAIFASGIPVLAGIGHEVDHSIADMTADLRAATPTHAAQLLWIERRELAQRADEMETALIRAGERFLGTRAETLAGLLRALAWMSPEKLLERWTERLQSRMAHLETAWERIAERREVALEKLLLRLEALNPMQPLQRGYVLARRASGNLLLSAAEAVPGECLGLVLHDGEVTARVEKG